MPTVEMPLLRLNDPDIRLALRSELASVLAAPGIRLCDELKVARGSCRLDLALIGDDIHGFEIKSDGDSLRRLERQVQYYGMVARRMTVVSGRSHAKSVRRLVPAWWGITWVYEKNGVAVIEIEREPLENPVEPDCRALLETLQKHELSILLHRNGISSGTSKFAVSQMVDLASRILSVNHVEREVSLLLRNRYEFLEQWSALDNPYGRTSDANH